MKKMRGQELVEFALVLPVFCVMLIGLFEVGRIIYTKHNLDKAVREASRSAAVIIDPITAVLTGNTICQQVLTSLNMTGVSCNSAVARINNVDVVRVTASYLFQPMLSSGQFAFIPQMNLSSNSSMRKEG